MEKFIKVVFIGLATMLTATGLMLGPGAVASAGKDTANNDLALKRDEDDVTLVVARDDDGDDDDSTESASRSRSRDRSRDVTSRDVSRSVDASGDQTSNSATSGDDSR